MRISTRSCSGVLPISVALDGNIFSCKFDCSFCPNETKKNGADKDIARSYLSTEGTFKRGAVCDFDAARQVIRRLAELESMGHFPDKLEIIVLGGTWGCYPEHYRETFLHRVFYGANVYTTLSGVLKGEYNHILNKWLNTKPFLTHKGLDFEPEDIRPMYSLEEEKFYNMKGKGARIIGIVLETRPDLIYKKSLLEKRRLGCTRIQLGIQHTSDMILEVNQRGHDNKTSISAIQKCKDNCFKVDIHIMPDLPHSHPSLDASMFVRVFRTEDYQPDYVKIYPCLDLPFTKTREWKRTGQWIPYAENKYDLFVGVLAEGMALIPPWTRVNRVHRDFPEAREKNGFLGYESETIKTNLHQLVKEEMVRRGLICVDIRSREIRKQEVDFSKVKTFIRSYWANGAQEWFISKEIPKSSSNKDDAWLLGFVRLRLPPKKVVYKSSLFSLFQKNQTGKIRELHVYGFVAGTQEKEFIQHKGIGKSLMCIAENVARFHGCKSVAVISGVGVRGYYERLGYHLEDQEEGELMKKDFHWYTPFSIWLYICLWIKYMGWFVHRYTYARAELFIAC